MRSQLLFLACVALVAAGLISPLAAQSTRPSTAPIAGVVVDTSGGAVPGATVTLTARGAASRTTTSDMTGRFLFETVRPGDVTVTVAAESFGTVTLPVRDREREMRIVLEPQGVVERVTVQGSVPARAETRSAMKTATPIRDVPQALTVVTREQMAEMSMQGIGDVVRYVPGVGIAQGEGNRDAPVLRGNTSTADFFVDGVRDDVQYFRDLYNVERVEALKGANAMVFGRGGVGGIINRVTKQPEWTRTREASLQVGSSSNRRLTADFGEELGAMAAYRIAGVLEDSGSYRDGGMLERQGVNPTFAFGIGHQTMVRVSYEYFHDLRTADRGIPSFAGRPVRTDASTFFGNADASYSEATVNVARALVEHEFSPGIQLRNHTQVASYDKFYQNIFPGAVNATGTTVSLSGYDTGQDRRNVFNQTDLQVTRRAGGLTHRLLAGVEVGRQATDNLRTTAFFPTISPTTTTVTVPLSNPVTSLPMMFAPAASDADNHGVATTVAGYVQDQMRLGRHVEVVAGIRYDRFEVDFVNNRTAAEFRSADNLISPRAGVIFKPVEPVSFYSSYTLSYLPRAGEQLSSLNLTNQALEPEIFRNYEVGAKWDVRPSLALSIAAYRLNRSNVAVTSPLDPTQTILVDGQRTEGVELGVTGVVTKAWSLIGGYAYQDGRITHTQSATVLAGAILAQVPEHSYSLWNRYDFSGRVGAGLGVIHRGSIFAATDNLVMLPAFTRVDAAVFVGLGKNLRGQLNIENLLDDEYYASAHSNNNIMPGSPRALRITLTTRF